MIRIGAFMVDEVSLKVVNEPNKLKVLDKIPGTIGSAISDTAGVDELGLGAPKPLSKDVLYLSFDRKRVPPKKTDPPPQQYRMVHGELEPIEPTRVGTREWTEKHER